ncbi:MAG: thioredoxin family protein [Prevotellaceae bacterium]|jgi:thiol:disulfide interchange protein DsbD|nr:thioredoxin family protein [Prevotellaceae bacterium]
MKNRIYLFLIILFCSYSAHSQILEPVKWTTTTEVTSATTAEIIFTAKMEKGWHVYAMDLLEDGPIPTTFKFETVRNAKLAGKVQPKSKLHKEYDPNFEMELRWYDGLAVFAQKIEFADAQKVDIQGVVNYMTCNDRTCLPPTDYEFEVKKLDASAFPKSTETAATEEITEANMSEVTAVKTDTVTVAAAPLASNDQLWKPVISELQNYGKDKEESSSLLLVFLSGLLFGFIALFTPCVWPVIPMTVSYFMKKGGDKRRGRRDAILYGFSIIIIYLALGTIITAIWGGSALNSLSTSAGFNIFLFVLLVVFSISFFGAFEITLPSSWTTKLDAKAENTSGFLGILLMAFVLALVSFSCTGPVIGTMLAQISTTGNVLSPMIAMLGFAIALAIPFTLFAFFPSWLKSMPKSGGWLNTVKVVLAFLELALSLKFLSVADMAYGWRILDRETFLAIWIVIFALLGFYLLGKIRFPHDSEQKHTSVLGLFTGIISLAFAVYMIPGLWGAPLKSVSAFAPHPKTQDFNLYTGGVHSQFTDYDLGMAYAAQTGKHVVIDFTGFGCVNCRKMETAVWTNPTVKKMLENDFVLISLWVDDKTPIANPYEVIENGKVRRIKTIGDKWSYLQRIKFGANAQPYYVMLDNAGNPLNTWFDFNEDPKEFIKWLKRE